MVHSAAEEVSNKRVPYLVMLLLCISVVVEADLNCRVDDTSSIAL